MSRPQILIVISAVLLLAFVLEQVRRRRLREEYSWIWLLTAAGYLLVALVPGLIEWVSGAIGSVRPTSVFAFLGLVFLFLISIQFSVQISRLTEQNKDLAQQIAILDSELGRLSQAQAPATTGPDNERGGSIPAELPSSQENAERALD
ncbi:MAG TPA: DUF2304 domain-containing protein [Anaerolineae bacterium]|nr:DUF2304 domain-containing protein [Anaerolineae bacterium]